MNIIFKKNVLILSLISLVLLICIFQWINYFVKNDYIVENFTDPILSQNNSINTTHSVDLPLTTTTSCQNFCGPPSRCAITGQQCFTDLDCPGCQPNIPSSTSPYKDTSCIPGDNDAGKLTWGQTPQYSTLTTDIGTRAKRLSKQKIVPPAMANFGVNVWKSAFVEDEKLFNQRFKASGLQFMPNYEKRPSLTGEFIESGPLASNAYFK